MSDNYLMQRLHNAGADALERFAQQFNRNMRLTLVARDPLDPKIEVVITDDEIGELKACLDRTMSREARKP